MRVAFVLYFNVLSCVTCLVAIEGALVDLLGLPLASPIRVPHHLVYCYLTFFKKKEKKKTIPFFFSLQGLFVLLCKVINWYFTPISHLCPYLLLIRMPVCSHVLQCIKVSGTMNLLDFKCENEA